MRTGHHSDLLELELGRRRIPFVKYGGIRYLEAAHVKDFLALVRLVVNPPTRSPGSGSCSSSTRSARAPHGASSTRSTASAPPPGRSSGRASISPTAPAATASP
jgi:DNA helicase-2/ATP-dependent DNA helicase PcrA